MTGDHLAQLPHMTSGKLRPIECGEVTSQSFAVRRADKTLVSPRTMDNAPACPFTETVWATKSSSTGGRQTLVKS